MIGELGVGAADDGVAIDAGIEHEHRVHALVALLPARAPTTAESRTPGSWFSTRSTSSGKTFSPSGVTIISFFRPRMKSWPSVADLADVAGVEPAVLERARGFRRRR